MVPPIEVTSPSRELFQNPELSPNDLWHFDRDLPLGLFEAVATKRDMQVFPDGKAIVDSMPKYDLGRICTNYAIASETPSFKGKETFFFLDHFEPPKYEVPDLRANDRNLTLDKYITEMWDVLTYYAPNNKGTLIGTPQPNLRPGDRFQESCYWDLADGIRGLLIESRIDALKGNKFGSNQKEQLALGVTENLEHLIDEFGYPPNGPRSYYLGRSQPNVLIEIVKELEKHFQDRDPHLTESKLEFLAKEYYWRMSRNRLVRLEDEAGHVHYLNRHWDDNDTPRPESFQEDITTATFANITSRHHQIFRDIRAACDSGRDFSGRWLRDPNLLETIHTTDFIPPELNSYMYKYEIELSNAYQKANNFKLANDFKERAERRKIAIDKFLWNEKDGCYYDYDFVERKQSSIKSIGTAYPVALGLSSKYQAKRVAQVLKQDLLKAGGFISTKIKSDEQWDHENGWPIDQVKAHQALLVAGDRDTAFIAASKWLTLNRKIFKATGVLLEKSNVVKLTAGSGGEYLTAQRGFLWSNGADRYLRSFIKNQVVVN